MNFLVNLATIVSGVASLIFCYDRFKHLFKTRSAAKKGSGPSFSPRPWGVPPSQKQQSAPLIISACSVTGLLLGFTGVAFGIPGYIFGITLGVISIGFCSWRDRKSPHETLVDLLSATVGFTLVFVGLFAALLSVLFLGLYERLAETTYSGPGFPVFVTILTSFCGFLFGYWARDI